jgi:hypothetical protein
VPGPWSAGGEWVEFLRALLDQPTAVDVDVLAALGRLIPADAVFYTDLVPHRRSRWAESSTLSVLPPCEPEGDEVVCRHVWSASCSHPDRRGEPASVTALSDFSILRA